MLFVGELLDANIKKEMSDEVKDFEANVSIIFNLNLNVGIHSKTGRHETVSEWTYMYMYSDGPFVFRYRVVMQVTEVWITKAC